MTTNDTSPDVIAPGTPFVSALLQFATARPDEVVITDADGDISRRELESRTNRLAREFQKLGVKPGDFVTIGLPNGIPFIEAMIAAWKLGATPQPVSFRLPARELTAIIGVAQSALVVGLDAGDAAPSVPVGFEPDATLSDEPLPLVVSQCWKAPTSGGSTGTPKVIASTGPAVVDVLVPLMPLLKMKQGGVKMTVTPLAHNAGVMFSTGPLITGGSLVIMPRFDPQKTLDNIAKYHVDWTCLVPTMLHRISKLPAEVRARADLSSIIAIATGGAMLSRPLKDFWIDWVGADRMVEFYSSTETQMIAIADGADWIEHPGTVGRVLIGEIQPRDDDGNVLPDGEVGELWVRRGQGAAPTYQYRGAAAKPDADGWETAGDVGWLDGPWLFLADRKADMAVVGGANVYPAEIEGALEEHPLVLSSCVVGIPDDEYGNVLHAVVQTSADVSDDELVAFLRERLVPYKIPRTFERSIEPVRDDAGKVRRSQVRERAIEALTKANAS